LEVGGQHHAPVAYPGEGTPVFIAFEAGWAPELVWTIWSGEKFLSGISNGNLRAESGLIYVNKEKLKNNGNQFFWSTIQHNHKNKKTLKSN
jgi:hypothetical protein